MRDDIQNYVQMAATSRTSVEILLYFLERPRGGLTCEALAEKIGRPLDEVKTAISELNGEGALGYLPDFDGTDRCYFNAALHIPQTILRHSDLQEVITELERSLGGLPYEEPGKPGSAPKRSIEDRRSG